MICQKLDGILAENNSQKQVKKQTNKPIYMQNHVE